ncbi:hypothetical protein [Glaesserella sp.]|uniref:hypothetical protein n=1 Tax=Glaesserella sp. TaxID=2094731 RepID=UPI0035A0CBA2
MMKKLLFVLFTLFSVNTLAVDPTQGPLQNDPALCAYGYNPNCYSGGYESPPPPPRITTTYYANFVALVYGKDGTPLFYRDVFYSDHNGGFTNIEWKVMQDIASERCNKDSNYAPCKNAHLAAALNGCIVVVESEHKFYANGADSCDAAKKIVMERCRKTDPKPKSCKTYALEQPCSACVGISTRKLIP